MHSTVRRGWAFSLAVLLILACHFTVPQAGPDPARLPTPLPETQEVSTPLPVQEEPVDEFPVMLLPFQDDFSSTDTGWYVYQGEYGFMDYESGGFRILVNKADWLFYSGVLVNARDIIMEVTVEKLGGPDNNSFGMYCRQQGDTYYFFEISSDGYFNIGRYIEDEFFEVLPWQESPLIHQGAAENRLRVECIGDILRMYVNGAFLAEVQDGGIAEAGSIGIMAGTFDEVGVDILFDDFYAAEP